jgi:hypothetical protein
MVGNQHCTTFLYAARNETPVTRNKYSQNTVAQVPATVTPLSLTLQFERQSAEKILRANDRAIVFLTNKFINNL